VTTLRTINQLLARVPRIGGQDADPLNGACSIPSHEFALLDTDGEITELVSVSDTPFSRTWLTRSLNKTDTEIPVEDYSGFPTQGDVYLDRETIAYTGKDTDTKTAQTASYGLTGQTADGGSKYMITDASRTEDELGNGNYWKGATLEVTAGTNVGEVRTLVGSYYDEESSRGRLLWDSPMPAACDATTVYKITMPPNRMICAGLTEADDYWNGAVVEITSGTNAGEVRWVQDFTASTDMLELVTPFPEACDNTTQFNITLYQLTGCTRGMYGSDAAEHNLTDEHGALIRRPVSDKVPFMKTRQVKIYENRVGCDEADAICTVGYIDDYGLDEGGTCYSFQCSGLLKLLARKLMSKQAKGKICHRPLWGGFFVLHHDVNRESYTVGSAHCLDGTVTWFYGFALEDGRLEGFTVNKVFLSSLDDFLDSGNIKIGNEILHYDSQSLQQPLPGEFARCLWFGDEAVDLDVDESGNPSGTLIVSDVEAEGYACYHNRGLFAEKIGAKNIKQKTIYSAWTQKLLSDPHNSALMVPEGLEVKAFIEEHAVNEEILQVCMCDDTPKSDFVRYDFIEYSSLAGGSFAAGDTITSGTSSIDAVVMEVTEDGTDGTLLVAFADPYWSSMAAAETITCGGVSATIDTYRKEVRPRNNVIDVVLQLLCSTGTAAENGPYDTLPEGFGLGIDQDLIDIDGIELLRDKWFAGVTVNFVLHEETDFKEWAENNVFRAAQVFPYETYEGKISLACMMTDAEARVENEESSLHHFDADHLDAKALPDWTAGKAPVSSVKLSFNKHPVSDEYMAEAELLFGFSREWYKDLARAVELELGCIYIPDDNVKRVNHKDPRIPGLLRRMMSVVFDRHAQYPCPVISIRAGYSDIKHNVGDPVLLTHSQLPNLRTSLRGLSSEFYQIIGRHPDARAGKIRFILWQIGVHDAKYARRAPSGKIQSFTANVPVGQATIVLFPRTYSRTGSKDIEHFSAGMKVCAVSHLTYAHLVGYEAWEIESVNEATNTIILTSNPTKPPSANYILEYAKFDDCSSGQQEGRVFMADENHLLGSGDDSAFKYL